VSKRKNNVSGLLKQLTGQKIDGESVNRLLTPTSMITQPQAGTEKTVKPPSAGDTRTSSLTAKTVPTGIKLGSPSSTTTSSSQSGSEWSNLLTQTASGGVASLTGGLGSIAGLGGLISGIASLFGGGGSKNTLPPLVEFQLPSSQTQTVYVSSNGSSTYQGSPTLQTGSSASSGPPFQYQSAQIAQAVKTALLNSSSLNDVIAEI
jgi:hypothetical protein